MPTDRKTKSEDQLEQLVEFAAQQGSPAIVRVRDWLWRNTRKGRALDEEVIYDRRAKRLWLKGVELHRMPVKPR